MVTMLVNLVAYGLLSLDGNNTMNRHYYLTMTDTLPRDGIGCVEPCRNIDGTDPSPPPPQKKMNRKFTSR